MSPTTRSHTLGVSPVKYEVSQSSSDTNSDSDADLDLQAASSEDEEALPTPHRRRRAQSSTTSSSASSPKSDRKRKRPVWDESSRTDENHYLDGNPSYEQCEVGVKEESKAEASESEDDHQDEHDQSEEEEDEEDWEWDVDLEPFSDKVMRNLSEDEMSEDTDDYDRYLAELSGKESTAENRPSACTAYEVFAAEQWSRLCHEQPAANYISLNVQLNELWAALDHGAKEHYEKIAALDSHVSEDIDMFEDDDSSTAVSCKVCAPCLVINAEVDKVYDLMAHIRDRAEFNWKIGRKWQSLEELIQILGLVHQGSLVGGDSEYHDCTACNHLGGAWGCLETAIAEVRMHMIGLKTIQKHGKKRIRLEMVMHLFGRHVW